MNTKLFIFAILAASLLSSVAAFNVPVFAGGDKDNDDDSNGGNKFQGKNDDGQQSFGLNECSNTQEDFEDSNDNVQNLNCEILINQLQDVRNTNNVVGNEGPIPGDGVDPGVEQCLLDLEAIIDAGILDPVVDADLIAELELLCEEGADEQDLFDAIVLALELTEEEIAELAIILGIDIL